MLAGTALNDGSEFLQLILVERQHFLRGILRLVLKGNDFHSEKAARNVDVGTLAVAVLFLLFEARARIHRQPGVADIGVLVDMDAADRSLDVHFVLASVLAVVYVDFAGQQREPASKS